MIVPIVVFGTQKGAPLTDFLTRLGLGSAQTKTGDRDKRIELTRVVVPLMRGGEVSPFQPLERHALLERVHVSPAVALAQLTEASPLFPGSEPALPVLVSSPHEGEFLPRAWFDCLTHPQQALMMFDVCDRGAGFLRRMPGVPNIGFPITRYAVDPNRIPDAEGMIGSALGTTILHDSAFGEPLYTFKNRPPRSWTNALDTWWRTYWQDVIHLVQWTRRIIGTHKQMLVTDLHTFPSVPDGFHTWLRTYGEDEPAKLLRYPAFVIGTRAGASDGPTCSDEVLQRFVDALGLAWSRHIMDHVGDGSELSPEHPFHCVSTFMQNRNLVGINDPFKGVANVQILHAIDRAHMHAIQVEVNEGLYFDPVTGEFNPRMLTLVRRVLQTALMRTGEWLQSQ